MGRETFPIDLTHKTLTARCGIALVIAEQIEFKSLIPC